MNQCAFLTMQGIEIFECYDELLYEPFRKIGWEVTDVPWRDPSVNWDNFDVVIIRSPWDYQDDPDKFMEVLQTIDASNARLENSLDIVRWNIDKTYLKDMQQSDIPIVPTLWEEHFRHEKPVDYFEHLGSKEIIIKPTISANADDTFRLSPNLSEQTKNELADIFSDRPFMVQPFLQTICTEGEFSLFYFGGSYSHAILKTPAKGDFRVQEEHGGKLTSIEPEPALLDVSNRTMQALPEMPLYARVDFVRNADGKFQLIELELIEPSLYFNMDAKSPQRFTDAFEQWVNERYNF